MKYDFEILGSRIVAERNKKDLSQDKLIKELSKTVPLGRNRLSELENGKAIRCDILVLSEMCKIFDCDLGYLMGEYSCKTRQATDIHAETGLSEEAVNELQDRAKACRLENPDIEVLSKLITMTEFWQMIREVRLMISADENYSDSEKNTVYQRNDSVTLTGKRIGDFHRNNAVSSFQYVLMSIRGSNNGNNKA